MRKTEFANDEYYHIFNCGVDKREVFLDGRDYERFLLCMDLVNDEDSGQMEKLRNERNSKVRPSEFRRSNLGISKARQKLVDIICYCLNPNHYHFILKQLRDGLCS